MKGIMHCDVCRQNKKNTQIYRAKFGKTKMYSACSDCQKEMKITEQILNTNHRKTLSSGKFKLKSGSFVLSPLMTNSYD